MSRTIQTISLEQLSSITGGQAQQAPEQEAPSGRTWGQVGRDYTAACVMGAGQSFMFGGRPRSVRQGLGQAALGCAMGVGMQAVQDVGGMISGR